MTAPTASLDATVASTIAEISAKHCIFQCGVAHYAISATTIREVAYLPPLVPVPRCPELIAGICHIRSEFVPVVSVTSVLGISDQGKSADAKQLLLLSHTLGTWGLMIDRVIAIDSIETHVDGTHRSEGQLSPILGTASFQANVVRVIDPKVLHRFAQQALVREWTTQNSSNRSQKTAVSS